MPAKSLYSLAVKSGQRGVSKLDDVGLVPYHLVKPLLTAILDPSQLLRIEENSPHIADSDAELWRAFIARDIPDGLNKIVTPRNPRDWSEVYFALVQEEKRIQQECEEKLRETLMGLESKREANKVNYIDTVVPQARKKNFRKFGSSTSRNHYSSSANPAARTGQTIMDKVRKEGAASAAASRSRIALHRPGNQAMLLANAKSQIKQAPLSMVREHASQNMYIPKISQMMGSTKQPRTVAKIFNSVKRKPNQVMDIALLNAKRDQEKKLQASQDAMHRARLMAAEASLVTPPKSVASHPVHNSASTTIDPVATKAPQASVHKDSNSSENTSHYTALTSAIKKRPNSIFMPPKRKRV